MLSAFKSSITLIPFKHVAKVDSLNTTGLCIYSDSSSSSYTPLYFRTREERDQQLSNFEKWLTIKTNSI